MFTTKTLASVDDWSSLTDMVCPHDNPDRRPPIIQNTVSLCWIQHHYATDYTQSTYILYVIIALL